MEREGHVATVMLDRPEQRNAISIAMLEAATKAFRELGDDPGVRVIVLAGDGDHFCAGADFSDLTIMQPPGHGYAASFEQAVGAIAACPVPVIARCRARPWERDARSSLPAT